MEVDEDNLKTSVEEEMLTRGLESELMPSQETTVTDEGNLKASVTEETLTLGLDNELTPSQETTLTAQDDVLTQRLGPGPATYVSKAHAVEFELQAGSLDEELPIEMTITRRLDFVNCRTEGSGRWDVRMGKCYLLVLDPTGGRTGTTVLVSCIQRRSKRRHL